MGTPISGYLETLKKRRATTKISRGSQMTGLTLAAILHDRAHKQIYLRLAAEYDGPALMRIAKDVAEREGVKNQGAYFMYLFRKERAAKRIPPAHDRRPKRRQLTLRLRKKRAK